MKKLRAILFDLDDTLYPESQFVLSGFRAVAKWGKERFGLAEESSFNRLKKMFDDGVRQRTFDLWLEEENLAAPEHVRMAVHCYRQHSPSIQTYPGVRDLLRSLHERYLLGMVTDGEWRTQERKIAALQISDFFRVQILTGQLGPDFGKPSPKPFLVALERLDIEGSSACYVGDNIEKDFFGARQAGLKTIRIRRSDGIYRMAVPPTPVYLPDYEIDSLDDLEEIVTVDRGDGKYIINDNVNAISGDGKRAIH